MVVVGDLIGKTVFAPAELPVGIVISIIGVPYFIFCCSKPDVMGRIRIGGEESSMSKWIHETVGGWTLHLLLPPSYVDGGHYPVVYIQDGEQ